MKVEGPSKTSGPKGAGKTTAKPGAGGASFSSHLGATDEVAGEAPLSGAANVGGLDALLALQAEQGLNPDAGAKRAKKRGLMLLDALDQIRIDLLMGGVPQARLDELQRMVITQRDQVMDPQLRAVLDEIDLRVQVELAKFSMK